MFSDEYADNVHGWDNLNVHFVQASKKPKWFWKAFRWILEKVFKKTIAEGIFISTDFGPNPAYTLYSKDKTDKIYIHKHEIKNGVNNNA